MTDPLSTGGLRKMLTDLCRLVADRIPAEGQIPLEFSERNEAAEKQSRAAEHELVAWHQGARAAIEQEYNGARRLVVEEFQTDHRRVQEEYDQTRAGVLSRFETSDSAARQAHREARWEATTVFEATKNGPSLQLREVQEQVDARWQELQGISQHAAHLLRQRWLWHELPEPEATASPPPDDALRLFGELVARARKQLRGLADQRAARSIEGARPLGMFVLYWLAAIYPSGLLTGWSGWHWIAASGAAAAALGTATGAWLYRTARRHSHEAYLALRQTLSEAETARHVALETAKATCQRQRDAIVERLNRDLKKADGRFGTAVDDLRQRKQESLEHADQKYPALLAEIAARRDRRSQETEETFTRRLGEIDERFHGESTRLREEHARRMAESRQCYQQQWDAMAGRWHQDVEHFRSTIEAARAACDRLLPDWPALDPAAWTPPAENPPAIRFGHYRARMDQVEGGVPKDDRLRPAQTDFRLPALLPFPECSLLLLRAVGEGRARAVEAIQAVMLRMLTAVPPAKVRFTIIDPVGLGENFSAFMHLADFDEKLVNSRIWTETAHVEQRLADLTQHMETVIQVYLRNEFETIQQYNEFAGELAEPYRVLVVANFPAGFSENAAQRLRSIVASGARCGVYTVLSADTKLRLPRDFHMADLEPHAFELAWKGDRFVWEHPDFGPLPLELDGLPSAERFTEIVRRVGQEVQSAGRVEVPFACAVPPEDQWWTADSRAGIDVPLGRAGAKKLQHLDLGKGTSQHLLVSGKTGSGKSTLWHALVTNTAIRYSPDEVELYLVDFKKGVEFKAYASSQLPHARVIAIESEREFGLSVLERLDAELRERGDAFRSLGVQDIQGFRTARPEARLPRVLLVIDEFQELFVEDDRVAQNAALMLDRLVRQGRAFGIHVLLGSQTLAGAYSLPRSTIGQMAVRIALQCSEADAHLILSEENTAARLLTRPGEAIYNDANGLYEGNHPFQVVWLPDEERLAYLGRISQLAAERGCGVPPPVVFEGNVPADPGANPLLGELLSAPSWPPPSHAPRAWLGAAVAIKDPTVAEFPRQGGSNLLLVGHREDLALGIMATGLVSLAAQDPPGGGDAARFYVLDGMRPDAPEAGYWQRVAGAVPHAVRVGLPRDTAAVIGEVAEEVARRQQSGREDAPPVYLCIYGLARFRELRRAEDDFGFSRSDGDKPASPAQQFAAILREGPPLGVHTMLWCDTYNNVTSALDRQGLREVEMRVLFQMNATDSSNLIDSTAAAQLGIHRAVLYNEGLGHLEKFRPYRPPGAEWLDWVRKQLAARPATRPAVAPKQAQKA